ncbi:MAG: right-handed parallel beta-helix repeat-containing protein, partial [Bacteroidota bacterium]
TTYVFIAYFLNLGNGYECDPTLHWWTYHNPDIQLMVNGNEVYATTDVPCDGYWYRFCATWDSDINTSAELQINMPTSFATGWDVGIDDVYFGEIEGPPLSITIDKNGFPCTESITANASTGIGPYTYLWNTTETTATISVTPGTYTVTVTDDKGCSGTAEIVILSCSCETLAQSAQTVNTSTITSNTVWEGKYYIPDYNVVTIHGCILDITNCDVIFGKCAHLEFEAGAQLRANNSVFRPCDIDDVWSEIYFQDCPDNIINDCVFKNATIALGFQNSDGKITNNEFYNCNNSIWIGTSPFTFKYPISGNHFEIDKLVPTYEDKCWSNTGTTFNAIHSYNISFDSPISQNNFVNGNNTNGVIFNGVRLENSDAEVSENVFSDMTESVEINSASGFCSIENNTIERIHGQTIQPTTNQIYINNSYWNMLIYNNSINNSTPNISVNSRGIYAEKSDGVQVRSNQIKGFYYGIYFKDCNYSAAIENTITDALSYGILVQGNDRTFCDNDEIRCNVIDLNNYYASPLIGIGFYDVGNQSVIYSNCIFNTHTGIYLWSPPVVAGPYPIPSIKNNFIYNYTLFGINSNNYAGVIGTPGLNTLSSNSLAIDIATNGLANPIFANMNWLNGFISTGVTLAGAPTYSNAACGSQISMLPPTQPNLNPDLGCDKHVPDEPLVKDGNSNFYLAPDYDKIISSITGDRLSLILRVQNTLSTNPDKTILANFNQEVISAGWIDENEKLWANYYYYLLVHDFNKAAIVLFDIYPGDINETDLWNIENVNLKVMKGQNINTQDTAVLKEICTGERTYTNYAVGVLFSIDHIARPYYFPDGPTPVYDAKLKSIPISQNLVEVYPNPAKDEITLLIISKKRVTVKLEDVTGRILRTLVFTDEVIENKIDISDLNSSIYLIVATDEDNKYVQRTKIVKMK